MVLTPKPKKVLKMVARTTPAQATTTPATPTPTPADAAFACTLRDKILQIFKNFQILILEDKTIQANGSGLFKAFIDPESRMVSLWRGDEELDNSTCPTDSLLISWCYQTAKEIQ